MPFFVTQALGAFNDNVFKNGLAAMLVFLQINGKPLHVPPPELYRIAMDVATNQIAEAEVAAYLKRSL